MTRHSIASRNDRRPADAAHLNESPAPRLDSRAQIPEDWGIHSRLAAPDPAFGHPLPEGARATKRSAVMGPAEIVASLKELCEEKGPQLGTDDIVAWIERIGGFESKAELISFAKKMKARQYARMLEVEDEDSGMRIKRLWSFYDRAQRRRFYADILELPEDQRKRLIRQYARFLNQLRTVRKAMADYFAGQRFFDFYPGVLDGQEDEDWRTPTKTRAGHALKSERARPTR
jgi:hypothetical protein